MNRLFLERILDNGIQTTGRLSVRDINGTEFWHGVSVELPWRDNQRKISCIPEGSYRIVKAISERFGEHIDVLNVFGRSGIKIHVANFSKLLLGCIAPGVRFADIDGDGIRDVASSRFALDGLLTHLPKESNLIITNLGHIETTDWKKSV